MSHRGPHPARNCPGPLTSHPLSAAHSGCPSQPEPRANPRHGALPGDPCLTSTPEPPHRAGPSPTPKRPRSASLQADREAGERRTDPTFPSVRRPARNRLHSAATRAEGSRATPPAGPPNLARPMPHPGRIDAQLWNVPALIATVRQEAPEPPTEPAVYRSEVSSLPRSAHRNGDQATMWHPAGDALCLHPWSRPQNVLVPRPFRGGSRGRRASDRAMSLLGSDAQSSDALPSSPRGATAHKGHRGCRSEALRLHMDGDRATSLNLASDQERPTSRRADPESVLATRPFRRTARPASAGPTPHSPRSGAQPKKTSSRATQRVARNRGRRSPDREPQPATRSGGQPPRRNRCPHPAHRTPAEMWTAGVGSSSTGSVRRRAEETSVSRPVPTGPRHGRRCRTERSPGPAPGHTELPTGTDIRWGRPARVSESVPPRSEPRRRPPTHRKAATA
jgi:hypothetical protein